MLLLRADGTHGARTAPRRACRRLGGSAAPLPDHQSDVRGSSWRARERRGTRGPNAGQRARAVCQAPGLQRREKTPAALQSPGRAGAGGSHRGAWRHRHSHALEVCVLAFPGRPRHHGGGSQLGSGVGGRPRGPHGRRQDGTEPAPRGDGARRVDQERGAAMEGGGSSRGGGPRRCRLALRFRFSARGPRRGRHSRLPDPKHASPGRDAARPEQRFPAPF